MVKKRRREGRQLNNEKLQEMRKNALVNNVKNQGSAYENNDSKVNLKSINRTIMKKDNRFKNIPQKLAKINRKTAQSKLLASVSKGGDSVQSEKINLISGKLKKHEKRKNLKKKIKNPKKVTNV